MTELRTRKSRSPSRIAAVIFLLLLAGFLAWWFLGERDASVPAAADERVENTQTALDAGATPDDEPETPRKRRPAARLGPEAQGVFIVRADAGADAGAQPVDGGRPGEDKRGLPRGFRGSVVTPEAMAEVALQVGTGAIEGVVRTRVLPPHPEAIKTTSDPVCAKFGPLQSPAVSIDSQGHVANAFVEVWFPIRANFPAPQEPIIVEQHGCQYLPRIQGALRGQSVQVRNEDGTLHNIHAYFDTTTVLNRAQPPGSPPVEFVPDAGSRAVNLRVMKLKCDVHPWMAGYILEVLHPYYAVSDAAGRFRIEGLPSGNYELLAWHELLAGGGTAEAVVTAGQTTYVDVIH